MKVLDLFSGIGGFSLGLERAGHNTVAFCEKEEFPQSILRKHWPSVPVYTDIKELTVKKLHDDGIRAIDIICGGFPCQPYSIAGNRRGQEDDRNLWPEMFRLIKEIKPIIVIGENVIGFITLALDDMLHDLESEGFACQTFIIPACSVGGIHRRERVWVIAYANNKRLQRHSLTRSNEGVKKKPTNKQPTGRSYPPAFRPIKPPTEPAVRHRTDGVPKNVAKLKALGNAVVPHIPEIIGRAILIAAR